MWRIIPPPGRCIGLATPCWSFRDSRSCARQSGCRWTAAQYVVDNIDITNNIISSDVVGLFLGGEIRAGGGGHTIDTNIIRGANTGLQVSASDNNVISNVQLLNNDMDLVISGGVNGNSPLENVSFENVMTRFDYTGDLNMSNGLISGEAPSGMTHIKKFLDIVNTSDLNPLEMNLTISYNDSDLVNIANESTLGLYKYVNGEWEVINYTLNETENYIYAELTEFSSYGIFGQEKSEAGGGGGGGGSYMPPVCGDGVCDSRRETYLTCSRDCQMPPTAPENVSGDLGDVGGGKNFEGSSGNSFRLKIKGQEHTIQIDGINGNQVILFIWSNPTQVTINVGETKQVDTDSNSYNDLEIQVKSIINGKASLFFKEINENIPPTPPEQPPTQPPAQQPSYLVPIIILAVIIVAVIVVVIIRAQGKKKRYLGYK
jgi:hypothetical protein